MKDDLQLFLLAFTTSLVQRKNAMDKTMADKLIYIPNNDTKKLRFSVNQNSQRSPKLLSERIRKHYYKTLGTSVINSPLSPLSLEKLPEEYYN